MRGVFCRQKRNEVHFLLVSLALGFPKECLCFVQSVIILVDITFAESWSARITKHPTIKPRKRRPVSSIDKRQSSGREVAGSNPGWTNTKGLQ